jgi:hypothetical protein
LLIRLPAVRTHGAFVTAAITLIVSSQLAPAQFAGASPSVGPGGRNMHMSGPGGDSQPCADFNPRHEPGGAPFGGRFACGEGKATFANLGGSKRFASDIKRLYNGVPFQLRDVIGEIDFVTIGRENGLARLGLKSGGGEADYELTFSIHSKTQIPLIGVIVIISSSQSESCLGHLEQ